MQIDEFLARRRPLLWAAFLFVFFATFSIRAAQRPFWFDELFTYYVTVQPTVADIFARLQERLDQHPPLYYLLHRVSLALAGEGEPLIAFRLPDALGLLLGLGCVFEFARRRHSELCGWVAVFLPLSTFVAGYAYDARPYGLMFGFSALAALAYLRAIEESSRKGWLATLGLALFLTVSVCYYGVLAFFPFALAEAVRWRERRRLDGGVAGALGAGAALTALYAPLALSNVAGFSTQNWASPSLRLLRENYVELFRSLPEAGACVLLAWGAWRLWSGEDASPSRPAESRSKAPTALAIGFLLLPLVLYCVAMLATHKMHPRYVIEASVGVGLLGAEFLAALPPRRSSFVGLVFLLALAGRTAVEQWEPIYWTWRFPPGEHRLVNWLATQPPELPVVVDNPMRNLELAHQNPGGIRLRLYYLVDPANAQRLAPRIVAGGRTWRRARRYMPIQSAERADFIQQNPEFLLYFSDFGDVDYILTVCREEGARVELLEFESTPWEYSALYRVRYPAPKSDRDP